MCVCFLPIHSGHQVRWTYSTTTKGVLLVEYNNSTILFVVGYYTAKGVLLVGYINITLLLLVVQYYN